MFNAWCQTELKLNQTKSIESFRMEIGHEYMNWTTTKLFI